MVLSQLLNELLQISESRQTDYAIVMHYSPSEISKYVTGTRIPPIHLIDSFIQKSAAYFGDLLWGEGRAGRLVQIFPVFSMPEQKDRLIGFLRHALRCAYEQAVWQQEGHVLSSSRFNLVLHGHDEIQDHVLIMLSCMFREEEGRVSVWLPYSFMRYLHCPAMPIRRADSRCTIVMNLLLHPDDRVNAEELMMLMQRWQNASGVLQIALWSCDELPAQPFYFKEGAFLILVNNAMKDNPIGLRILRPDVLLGFLAQRNMQQKRRISYSLDQEEEFEAARQLLLEKLPRTRGAFLSTNTFFLQVDSAQQERPSFAQVIELVQATFQSLAEHSLRIVVSSQAVGMFAKNGGFHVPFLGSVQLTGGEMEQFLQMPRDSRLLHAGSGMILTNLSLPGLSVLILEDELLIHSMSVNEQPEQLLLLPISLVSDTVQMLREAVDSDGAALSMDRLMAFIQAHASYEGLRI